MAGWMAACAISADNTIRNEKLFLITPYKEIIKVLLKKVSIKIVMVNIIAEIAYF